MGSIQAPVKQRQRSIITPPYSQQLTFNSYTALAESILVSNSTINNITAYNDSIINVKYSGIYDEKQLNRYVIIKETPKNKGEYVAQFDISAPDIVHSRVKYTLRKDRAQRYSLSEVVRVMSLIQRKSIKLKQIEAQLVHRTVLDASYDGIYNTVPDIDVLKLTVSNNGKSFITYRQKPNQFNRGAVNDRPVTCQDAWIMYSPIEHKHIITFQTPNKPLLLEIGNTIVVREM